MTPCTVWLAISSANSSSVTYSGVNRCASKSVGVSANPRVVGHEGSEPACRDRFPGRRGRARDRSSTGSRTAPARRERSQPGSNVAISRTRRGKSSGPPGVGSAQTSRTRKSLANSWIRHGRAVCSAVSSNAEPNIQYCMLDEAPASSLDRGRADGRPDPHTAEHVDRRRACRHSPRADPTRCGSTCSRRLSASPGAASTGTSRADRSSSMRCWTRGSTEAPTRFWSA